MPLWNPFRRWLNRPAVSPGWLDPRPPDGLVEILPTPALPGSTNLHDPRFLSYLTSGTSPQEPLQSKVHQRRSVPRLGGRVVIASLFVGRDGISWSPGEIARAHRALERAGLWLEAQAARWHAPLNIMLAQTYFEASDDIEESVAIEFLPEGERFGPYETNAAVRGQASASRAAAQLGFADFATLAGRVTTSLPADYWVWILHLRRAGRSFAIPEPEAGLPGVNLAVCYAHEASFSEPLHDPPFSDPVTIVHEILHLFGATDKYGLPLSHFPAGEVTRRDVMLLYYNSLPRIQVDPLTAREVGWT